MVAGAGERVWNVLVVDDEADLLALVRLTLEYDDLRSIVATASTAAEALASAAETTPDLVVLDQMLGGPVTGLHVARQLRLAHPEARVILFSASDVIDLREHAVDAVLAKMDVGELPTVIRQVLEHAPES